MIQKIGITLALLTATVMPILFASPVVAQEANIAQNLCAGANLNVYSNCNTNINNQSASDRINGMIATVINFFSLIVGVVAVIMIIVGGFKYITSGGDSSNVTSAKNTILYAIIGLIIVALAQWIVRFVLDRVT
ncbi:hypothetical protein H0X10_04235 [Candidatus Saccharibacteria bacterium]|nr:hypothetical protein [Candidatus Saccharibacteria bacterium]